MANISPNAAGAVPGPILHSFKATRILSVTLPWGRFVKLAVGVALLSIGALTTYQQVMVRVSREALVNARVVSIRAPIDGIVKSAAGAPGTPVHAGMAIAQVEDPTPDD